MIKMKNIIGIKFWGVFLLAVVFFACTEKQSYVYQEKMNEGVEYSLKHRNDSSSVWNTAGWWNSANVLTALIRYAEVSGEYDKILTVVDMNQAIEVAPVQTEEVFEEEIFIIVEEKASFMGGDEGTFRNVRNER